MYKHILVAVDGSDTSNRALDEAIRLAGEQQAALRVVHVVDLMRLSRRLFSGRRISSSSARMAGGASAGSFSVA
jgi:nucleotide-binding universal stress UspA family protein